MSVTIVENTDRQLHVTYDTSKIFIFDNRFEKGDFLNDSGGIKSFIEGTLVGRVTASGKLVELKSGSVDGSEIPFGVLFTPITDLGIAAELEVSVCVFGEVVKSKVILNGADTLETIISGRRLKDRIAGDTQGIKLVASTELTGTDNS